MRRIALILVLPFVGACVAHDTQARILFLCPYGGAKSVIAASYFNQLAQQRALPYVAVAAAAEEPYAAVPTPVVGLLQRDGFDVTQFKPRRVETRDIRSAAKIVSIDCNLEALDLANARVERWDDVPKVSEDLEGSAAAIRRHVQALVEELRGGH
jgi:protein-tyrosine-phosphatase